MGWAIIILITTACLTVLTKYVLDDLKEFVSGRGMDAKSIIQPAYNFIMPYSVIASWGLIALVTKNSSLGYIIFYSFILFMLPLYYQIIFTEKGKFLFYALKFGIIFILLDSIFSGVVSNLSVAVCAFAAAITGTMCLNAGIRMRYINMTAPLLSSVVLSGMCAASSDTTGMYLTSAIPGSFAGYFVLKRCDKDINGAFFFYCIMIVTCELYKNTSNVFVLIPVAVMGMSYACSMVVPRIVQRI